MTVKTLMIGVAAALAAAAVTSTAGAQANTQAPPRLVVFITVDQLAEPYLDRFASEFRYGLKRMTERGSFFDNAFHDHAVTETAVGHATVLSGRFPRSTGIFGNDVGTPDPAFPLINSRDVPSSPFRFRGSVLMDWMRMIDPASRGLSVSKKDRGAILPLGRSHEPAFWYTLEGRFTTSTWYGDSLPTWVQQFNARALPQSYAGRSWTLFAPASQYTEPDSVPIEGGGRDFTFPHILSATPATAARQLPDTPFMDEVIVSFALAGMHARQLGTDDHPDLLAVSLSTTDYIGHRYGQDSREVHDQILRLDSVLGALMDSIYTRVDSTRVIFALSADHGTTPFPELRYDAATAAAMHVSLAPEVAALRADLKKLGIDSAAIEFGSGSLEIDPRVLARTGADPMPVVSRFVAAARAKPGVADARLARDVARGDTVRNIYVRRWNRMLAPDTRMLAVVSLKPGHVWGRSRDASHGSPNDSDAHVPIIFYGAPFAAGRVHDFARTVDIAPTLAAALGVKPTEKLDGVVLRKAFKRSDGTGNR